MSSGRRFWHTVAVTAVIGLLAAGCGTTPPEEGVKPKPTKVEPTGPHASLLRLFPAVGDVTDWKAQGDARVYGPAASPIDGMEAIADDPGAPQAMIQGFGYLKSATRKYVRGSAGETVTVRAFEMKGPQEAFGLFSVGCTGTQFPTVGLAARMSTHALGFVKGLYFVSVEYGGTNDATPVLMEFGRYLADQISSPGYRPAILESFPLGSLEGERYYLHTFQTLWALPFSPKGDASAMARALALSPDTDVAVIGYPTDRPGVLNYLFVIHYPTDADAQSAFTTYEGYLDTSTSPADRNVTVAPPAHAYLAGTFNAEENSVNDLLARLLQGLGG
jgi:hypothetical protein